MRFSEEEENSKTDYFDGPDLPDEQEVKKEKRPEYKPDDPEYWEQDESEWEYLQSRPGRKFWLWTALCVIVVALFGWIYIWFFQPYAEGATQCGYVERIDKRGILFKTFEGVLLPYKELMDTTRVYKQDFNFSVTNAEMAVKLKKAIYNNNPVRVEYKVYHTAMPWRGDRKILIVQVDSVDRNKILPPEYTPDL